MKSNKSRRKPQSRQQKPAGRDDRPEVKDPKYVKDTERNNTFGGNSIEWYNRNPNLLLAAGSIPYPYKPGMRVPMGEFKSTASDTKTFLHDYVVPGVLSIEWMPSVGYSDSQTSPISIVGKEIYAKVREKYSGSLDADAPDFVIYLMALDSIFSYIAHLKRVYRISTAYSPENLTTPVGLLNALGLTPAIAENLRQNKMTFYQRINELVLMTRKFKCPRIMDVFNRHVWLNDHVYTDAPSIKSQFYIFSQVSWFKYTLLDVPGQEGVKAGGLQLTPYFPLQGPDYVNYLYQYGKGLIDALAASDDGYLISGYLMRAYEGYPDFYVDELLLGEQLIPKYNEEVLGEIENLHTIPSSHGAATYTVRQDPSTNAIISKPTFTISSSDPVVQYHVNGAYPRFNARSDSPTVAETVINSRLMTYIGEFSTVGQSSSAPIYACTEVVMAMNLLTPSIDKPEYNGTYLHSELFLELNEQSTDQYRELSAILASSAWDWMPLIYVKLLNDTRSFTRLVGDVHNVTTVNKEALINLNTVCLYSLFNTFSA